MSNCKLCNNFSTVGYKEPCKSCANYNNWNPKSEEDVKLKEYQTWEVIKMLSENPKLEFVDKTNKVTIVTKTIVGTTFLKVKYENSNNEKLIDNLVLASKWTLANKPVSFMEAVQAYQNGKSIKVEFKDCGTFYHHNATIAPKFSAKEILEGVWFINED